MLEQIIRRVPFFSTLPARHVRWLADTLEPVDILEGTLLLSEGDSGDFFYVVIQGEIEIFKRLEDGGEEVIGVRGPGEYVGEMSLLNANGLRTAGARARVDSEALLITRSDFDALLHRYPPLGYAMARVMGERLEQAHNSSIQRLEERNRQLQAALDQLRAAQAELVETRKLEHELALAREIQLSLLPPALPRIQGYDFGARLLPMMQVGGDFYDFIPLDDNHIGIAIGDVSGHGVPAALIMAITVAMLRAEACRPCLPSAVLTAVNDHLFKLGANRTFVTALFGSLNTATGEFIYARAGHEPPLLLREGEPPRHHLEGKGRLLGLFDQLGLTDGVLRLAPGDSLVLYTDGVVEARSPEQQFFGEEGLIGVMRESAGLGAQALCDRILAGVAAHAGLPAQSDDIAVVTVTKTRGG